MKHIHPPHWWVGMNSPHLQILIHGDEIRGCNVTIENEDGVRILDVVRFDNPNYIILYLDIKDATPHTFGIVFEYQGDFHVVPYELKERACVRRKPLDASDVVYLIMPDRFSCGINTRPVLSRFREKRNSSRNPDARHGGDIAGMTERLDYLADLGVTAIWHTPVLENDMPEYSYHGYAITDYYHVDPRFGTSEDYRNFVEEAHRRGIKVVKDIVFNHCGNMNFLYMDMPAPDWFSNDGRFVQTSFRPGAISDMHSSFLDRHNIEDGWFVDSMPNFNQRNYHVMTYLIQTSVWWVEFAGIDGIRQDTYPYNDKDVMVRWCKTMDKEYPGFSVIGETWINHNVGVSYWQKDSPVAAPFNSHLPIVMDFPLMSLINRALDEETDEWNGLGRIYEYISQDKVYANPLNLLTFFENHDTDRLQKNSLMSKNVDRYKQALTLILTLRGIPQLYSGTEIGMFGNKSLGDGVLRKNFPGGWISDKKNAFNADGRSRLQNEYFDFTRGLLRWRKTCLAIAYGSLTHYLVRDGVYVYSRQLASKVVTVFMNGTDETKKISTVLYSDVIPYSEAFEVLSGVCVNIDECLILEKRGIRIFEF